VMNFSMCRPDKHIKATDFVPGWEDESLDLSKMTPEQVQASLMSAFNKKEFIRH
jgi:hypothetical protein